MSERFQARQTSESAMHRARDCRPERRRPRWHTSGGAASHPGSKRNISTAAGPSGGWFAQNWGLLALAGLAALIPVGVVHETQGHVVLQDAVRRLSGGFRAPNGPYTLNAAAAGMGTRSRALSTSRVSYSTQLEVYMCSEVGEASEPSTTQVESGVGHLEGLGEPSAEAITVDIKLAPNDDGDLTYKCTDGQVQWHIQVRYTEDEVTDVNTTPAEVAAAANDYVAYSGVQFKTLLTEEVNQEVNSVAASTTTTPLALTGDDFLVVSVGWICSFHSTPVVSTTAIGAASVANGMVQALGGSGMWPWWAWMMYGLAALCCLIPLLVCVFRRAPAAGMEDDVNDYLSKGRKQEGLSKIYGPEWGITELDFDENYQNYQNDDMKQEYDNIGQQVGAASYRVQTGSSANVGDTAWQSEASRKSQWTPQTHAQAQTMGQSSPSPGAPSRKFDIDDEEAETSMEHLRRMQPRYSFDLMANRASSRHDR